MVHSTRFVSRRLRLYLVVLGTLLLAGAVFLLPPIGRGQAYHDFADQRSWLGIPNALNVLSNLVLLVAGIAGLSITLRRHNPPLEGLHPAERWPYVALFLGVLLTAIGSAYYHVHPDDARALWDRLPVAILLMAFLDATITERIDRKVGLRLLPWLLALGAGSVIFWTLSEIHREGDLRYYGDGGLLALLLIVFLFPSPYTRQKDLFITFAWYGAAKLLELFDKQTFQMGHVVSGHTLKHVAAGIGFCWLARMILLRRPVSSARV